MLQAAPGSAHGYDVVDHRRLNDELGGEEAWHHLVTACHDLGLGLVVDVVPNHMAVPVPESLNAAFWDVLRLGRSSSYADWFDVDWDWHDGRLLLPVLGRPLADALGAGEVTVDAAASVVRYFDHEFPLAPGTRELDQQHYLLAHWRTASTELNWRRFFDVTSLIGVRVERDEVFDATHATLLRLVRDGDIDGLRIDHPDGLADPQGYLDRLGDETGSAWTVVEKILEPGELLPRSWRTAGSTGYDAIAAITHLLLDPSGEQPLSDLYAELTGGPTSYLDVVRRAKRDVVDALFGSEVTRLLRDLAGVPTVRDHAADRLRAAIEELLVAFDVYRAYADDAPSRQRVDDAERSATAARPDLTTEVTLLCRLLRDPDDGAAREFATRFEQTTGPVMAKGVEDTGFYRYLRLVALNEVGGDPGAFGHDVGAWHRYCALMAEHWPTSMTTLTTHDTKRSEDVRARLLVLAECPDEWRDAVTRWRDMAARHQPVDANTDYLFWQTLAAAWPLSVERMRDYLVKATHEAKQHTSWLTPDEGYERRLTAYAERVMTDSAITDEVTKFVEMLAPATRSNVAAQKLLQLTMPGVADTYQGQEVADRSLVDPDNRRPVDYAERRRRLAAVEAGEPAADLKLLVTTTALRMRRERPATFLDGGYDPVEITGPAAGHAVAFRRGDDVVTVVTRLPLGLARRGGWGDTGLALPDGDWHDLLTGRPARSGSAQPRLADLLDRLPVALLVRAAG